LVYFRYPPNCDFPAAIRNDRSTSIRDIAPTSQLRKYRSIGDGCRTGQFGPFAAV
jgi:hypothetical protein